MSHKKKEKIKGLYTVIDKHTGKELGRNLTLEAIENKFFDEDDSFANECPDIKIIFQK